MICKIIGQCQLFLGILSDFLCENYKRRQKIYLVHSLIHVFSP
jgi:hypothetical protein